MFADYHSSNRPIRPLPVWRKAMVVALGLFGVLSFNRQVAACDCGCEADAAFAVSDYDFFTNYGNYMPRAHCLRTAEGDPDWPWIVGLIALSLIIVAGYLKIVFFWRRCYLDERVEDRDVKLKELATIFVLCATCGYGFSVVIFFWPVYRMQAIAMLGLALATWRFAIDLEPFRQSFTARRLQRELNEALQNENETLNQQNEELTRVQAELTATLDELQKTNKDLDQFVYAASHDLRSPLRAIESLAEFVIEDVGDLIPEPAMDDLNQLQGRVHRMERMLNDLLSYSRMRQSTFESESFPVREAISEAVELIDVPKEFTIEIKSSNDTIVTPKAPLGQVLRNLVDNAIKHHDGDKGMVTVESQISGDFVCFKVRDDGPGISPEDRSRIFEMFTTLHRRDEVDTSGMGLALVKRVVESHGGSIDIEASNQRGATFCFTWPRVIVADDESCKSSNNPQSEEAICV